MKQSNERPPNYDLIVAAIPSVVNYPQAFFCYGDTIYNPSGAFITREKIAHELVHSIEQLAVGVDWWWEMYLKDKSFRFAEEVAAYQKEYEEYCKHYSDRNSRNKYLNWIANDLAAEPYGARVTVFEAVRIIKNKLPASMYVD